MTAQIVTNMESIGQMLGTLKGLAEGLDEDRYMEAVIKEAHGKAASAFDLAAAATGAAGHLTHVFEFGTAGITRGIPKFPDPTHPSARLWVHTLTGQGGMQDVGYSFRPALNRNPQPTTAETGVPSKYLQKLSRRKYVFRHKAFVMETGMTVSIKARNSDFLFIPTPGNPLNKKGFVMYNTSQHGPITAKPGKTTKGTFTAFWMSWWASAGQNLLEQEMSRTMAYDITKYQREADKKVAAAERNMKPVQTTNILGAVRSGFTWGVSKFGDYRKSRKTRTI